MVGLHLTFTCGSSRLLGDGIRSVPEWTVRRGSVVLEPAKRWTEPLNPTQSCHMCLARNLAFVPVWPKVVKGPALLTLKACSFSKHHFYTCKNKKGGLKSWSHCVL